MTVVGQDQRLAELRRIGLSEPLIRLAAGECLHQAFRGVCLGPSYYAYHGAKVPAGPPLIPLWDRGDLVAGVWQVGHGLEFIEFSIEAPEELRRLTRTEQGFWVTRFDFLYECDVSDEDLQSAANKVGFQFLDRHLTSREAAEEWMHRFDEHQSWLGKLVEEVDREASGGQPGVPTAR